MRDGKIVLQIVSTSEMVADILTESLHSGGMKKALKKNQVGDHDGE